MLASYGGHVAAVPILLATGANVNAQDGDGTTALMYAASSSTNRDIVNALIMDILKRSHQKDYLAFRRAVSARQSW